MAERPPRGLAVRPAVVAAVLVLPVLSLGACGGGPDPATPPTPSGSPAALWNPCDGLDVDAVGEALGGQVTKDGGDPTAPRCAFTPLEQDGAALDANYLLFPAGLDAAWDTMGDLPGRQVDLEVPGADAGRLVVKFAQDSLLITGFVQNGDLIQVVNLVEPAPFDRDVAVSAMRTVLADLSAHAATREPS